MSQPAAPPVLTVRYEGSERTFAAGHDVVVGRDLRADVRVAHPLISRAHLLLRFDQGRWVAIDNGSLNGLYLNNRRVPVVDIYDAQRVHIGNPDGPALDFEVGRHRGSAGRPPQTTSIRLPNLSAERGPPTARRRPARSAPASYNSFHRPPPGYPPLRHRDHSRDTPPVGNSCGHPADRNGRRRFTGHPRPHRRRRVPAAELRRETSRHR